MMKKVLIGAALVAIANVSFTPDTASSAELKMKNDAVKAGVYDEAKLSYMLRNLTWTEGKDGRRVVYPTGGWTWTEGADGRRVAYPSSGWAWTEGKDGRRVVYPSNGWTWEEGRDGRRVVRPSNGWTWNEGQDGRCVVYPSNGWTWTEGGDGRCVAYQISSEPDQSRISLFTRELRLSPDMMPYADLLLRQMGVIEE